MGHGDRTGRRIVEELFQTTNHVPCRSSGMIYEDEADNLIVRNTVQPRHISEGLRNDLYLDTGHKCTAGLHEKGTYIVAGEDTLTSAVVEACGTCSSETLCFSPADGAYLPTSHLHSVDRQTDRQ